MVNFLGKLLVYLPEAPHIMNAVPHIVRHLSRIYFSQIGISRGQYKDMCNKFPDNSITRVIMNGVYFHRQKKIHCLLIMVILTILK
jgi:hypothetical protein